MSDMSKPLPASARCDESTMREFDKSDIHIFWKIRQLLYAKPQSSLLQNLVSAFLKIAKCNIGCFKLWHRRFSKSLFFAFLKIAKCNIGCFKLWHFANVLISKRAFHISWNWQTGKTACPKVVGFSMCKCSHCVPPEIFFTFPEIDKPRHTCISQN